MPDYVPIKLKPLIVGLDPTDPVDRRETKRGEAVPAAFRSGTVVSTPCDGGREVQADTISCRHCGFTWVPKPGSGRRRGFCMTCNGFVCGRYVCERWGCVPGGQERHLDNIEKGLPINHVGVAVSFPVYPTIILGQ